MPSIGRAYPLSVLSARRNEMQRVMRRPSSQSYPNVPAGQGSICTSSRFVIPRRAIAAT